MQTGPIRELGLRGDLLAGLGVGVALEHSWKCQMEGVDVFIVGANSCESAEWLADTYIALWFSPENRK